MSRDDDGYGPHQISLAQSASHSSRQDHNEFTGQKYTSILIVAGFQFIFPLDSSSSYLRKLLRSVNNFVKKETKSHAWSILKN